jgi:hypothetical protein
LSFQTGIHLGFRCCRTFGCVGCRRHLHCSTKENSTGGGKVGKDQKQC